ncbi:uncharacterized protein PAF06_018559 [Gastrophryne carolinensis]
MADLRQVLPHRYDLELDISKKNVFVTQLEEGRDEEEENLTQIPIIREAAGKILANSKNTLQKTLVLKKEVEYDRISQELLQKREEFSERMRALEARREEFKLRETEYSDKATKFEKFLKDSEAKQRRAIAKCQAESRQNELRKSEISELANQLRDQRIRQQMLHETLKKNQIYEDFLLQMMERVPDNYLEYGVDSPVKAIIRRYETLYLTNENLVNNLSTLADEYESVQHKLEELKRQHDTSKLTMTSELSKLQLKHDRIRERNTQLELNFNREKSQFRNQSVEIGSLLLAVINLADQCHMKHYGPLAEVELAEKMDMIKEFILEKIHIERLAKKPYEELLLRSNPGDYASRQKKNDDHFNLLSEKYDFALFIEEHASQPSYQRNLQELQTQYGAIRQTCADGSCFFRGLGFAYLEFLAGKPQEVMRFRERVMASRDDLIVAGFQEDTFRGCYETFLTLIDLAERDGSAAALLRAFNQPHISDHAIQYLRLVTSAFLRNAGDFYTPFLGEGQSMADFCSQVEPMMAVCDHIHVSALTQALAIPLQVEYVGAAERSISQLIFPEGVVPSVYMLYKQDHYSVLYQADRGRYNDTGD